VHRYTKADEMGAGMDKLQKNTAAFGTSRPVARRWLLAAVPSVAVMQQTSIGLCGAQAMEQDEQDDMTALRVGARTIPVPKTLSAGAQRFLATPFTDIGTQPEVDDLQGWRDYVARVDKALEPVSAVRLKGTAATTAWTTMGGAKVSVGTPAHLERPDMAHLAIHGGAWTVMGGEHVKAEAAVAASQFGCMAFAVDYRMAPDHPFPAGLDDCVAAYRELLKRYKPGKIVISGASAGGNLTAAATLKIRDLGLPMPGVVGMMTPATDLSWASDSITTNLGVDTVLRRRMNRTTAVYTRGHSLDDPYVSPVYGDFSKGFPPSFLQTGTRDALLSDTVRLHRALVRAGIEAELHVGEAMPHAGFGSQSPEDLFIQSQFKRFVHKHIG
jgi:monoterpene epsilon-lactone hydrolase